MVFSSIVFLFFTLPIVLAVYFVCPRLLRNAWLLIASLVIYAWAGPQFLGVMLGVIALNYVLGITVHPGRPVPQRRLILGAGIATNLLVLGTFKYADFVVGSADTLLGYLGAAQLTLPHVALPIGISFFIFHCMSYVIDVYRGDAKPQRNPFNLALYISLFPQLIAGPIVRYRDVASQILERTVTLDGFAYGVRRFLTGLGKKVLIANTVAVPADEIFGLKPHELSTPLAWLGIVCYTLQIYFDFSGYSDMAIGLGHMFGFRFKENFQWPYIAQSIREFWRRWHISLSNWFRDYLYIPLGGNRGGEVQTARNLLTVFFLCGLWHGASWTFVVWGLYHGTFLVLERFRDGAWTEAMPRPLRHAYVLFVVSMGWVLFRADDFTLALNYFGALFGIHSGSGAYHPMAYYLGEPSLVLALAGGAIGSMPWVKHLGVRVEQKPIGQVAYAAGALACIAIFVLSSILLSSGTNNPFIYFRF